MHTTRSAMLLQTISVILFLAASLAQDAPLDFCDPKWCPDQGTHIACNNNGSFGIDCIGYYWLVDINPYKQLILDLHNEFRNRLAMGQVARFRPAARMPYVKWDKKLTLMAELNVKTCKFEHDECRSTAEFPYSGQNIYFAQTTLTNYSMEDFIKEAIEMWFLEYKDCNMDVIDCFRITEPQTGHFTALMLDRNDRVGCGYLRNVIPRENKKPLIKIIFTCNYPSTNILDFPTYLSGEPASLCKTVHYSWNGLCTDPIDPNNFNWYWECNKYDE